MRIENFPQVRGKVVANFHWQWGLQPKRLQEFPLSFVEMERQRYQYLTVYFTDNTEISFKKDMLDESVYVI